MSKKSSWDNIPKRVFLDTNTINFILDHGETIFENISPEKGYSKSTMDDIFAFHDIFLTGQRAGWQIAVSPMVYPEVFATPDPIRFHNLHTWLNEVFFYWLDIANNDPMLPS
jgi:hypothetical protein